jgi:hypothetical protein
MKTLLIAVISLAFFSSCEKELSSLKNTTWSNEGKEGELYVELVFTDSQATITEDKLWGIETFTGTYTFDPPNVTIIGDVWISDGVSFQMPYDMIHKGTVKGRTMEIAIQAYDTFMITTLEKQ